MGTPGQRVLVGADDLHLDDRAHQRRPRPAPRRARSRCARCAPARGRRDRSPLLALAGALHEHPLPRPHQRRPVRAAEALHEREEARQALALDRLGHVVAQPQRRRERARRVLEAEDRHEAHLLHQRKRLREVVLRLAGEADDDVGRQGEPLRAARALCRRRGALDVLGARVAADHPPEHAVAPRLHRQVHVLGQDVELGVGARERRRGVPRVGARVAEARQARAPRARWREAGAETASRRGRRSPAGGSAGIAEAVHRLPEEHHLARARLDEARTSSTTSRAGR